MRNFKGHWLFKDSNSKGKKRRKIFYKRWEREKQGKNGKKKEVPTSLLRKDSNLATLGKAKGGVTFMGQGRLKQNIVCRERGLQKPTG